MATRRGALDTVASVARRAAVARARAAHAGSTAERHTVLADQAATEALRDVHTRIAARHESTASCHLTVARLRPGYGRVAALPLHVGGDTLGALVLLGPGRTPLSPGLLELGQALTDAAGWTLEHDRQLRESRALADQLGYAPEQQGRHRAGQGHARRPPRRPGRRGLPHPPRPCPLPPAPAGGGRGGRRAPAAAPGAHPMSPRA